MNQPKVSIVVPCYKVEKYLDRCVNSLINQTLSDIEIILVDDGSPDNVPRICDIWAQKDLRIKVIHKQNEGLGLACNSGLEIATGKFIAFCDSDDWVEPQMYEIMADRAEKYSAQMVFSGIQTVFNNGSQKIIYQSNTERIYNSPNDIYNFTLGMISSPPDVKKERQIPMSAKIILYDRSFLSLYNIKFQSERKLMSEDLFFNLDCLQNASCVVEVPKTFYNYFVNINSLSQTIRTDRFKKTIDMKHELETRYKDNSQEYRLRVNRLFIGYSRSAIVQICKSKSISITEKLKLLNDICTHSVWDGLKQSYPIQLMPFSHRVFLKCILNNNKLSLLLLSLIK